MILEGYISAEDLGDIPSFTVWELLIRALKTGNYYAFCAESRDKVQPTG
jgi:hypothetical protein